MQVCPLLAVAHLQFCGIPASHSPSPKYAARTVPWFRNPVQEFHSATPTPLISFSADTIHAAVSTLPGHCDQALLERFPMLVPHTDDEKGIHLSREHPRRCLIWMIQRDLRSMLDCTVHSHASVIRQCRSYCTKLETPTMPFIFTS